MHYKIRKVPRELEVFRVLNSRTILSVEEKQNYLNMEKGFEGEQAFDKLTESLQCDCLILNDLLLKMNNTVFQIDTLMICPDMVYIFEIKNFEGDFYYESDKMYINSKMEIMNPLNQLNRTESLFRQLLQKLGYNIPLLASVVFINSEFTLYQSPLNKPFIFPTQIKRFIGKLENNKLKLSNKHKLLAEKMLSLHLEESPYEKLPTYHYEDLKKGIVRYSCQSLNITVDRKKNCYCNNCGHEELVMDAVMRSVREFKLLFPDKKVTTNMIHDWCKVISSKKRIRKILDENFTKVGGRQRGYY